MKFDVRDTRNKNWLWMRRELLREHGDELGTRGVSVYAALATFTDETNTAYPSIGTLAEMLGISRPTVRNAINDLVRLGWLGYEERTDNEGGDTSHLFYLLECPVENDLGGGGNSVSTGSQTDFHKVERKEVEHTQSAHAHEGDTDLPPHAPTEERVVEYGTSAAGLREEECRKFWRHYSAVDWLDPQGRKISNWKLKLGNWDVSSHKYTSSSGAGASGDGEPTRKTPELVNP